MGEEAGRKETGILSKTMGGGPMDLGDPDDVSLRRVEKDLIIPKMMKKRAHAKCSPVVKEFNECGKVQGFMSFIRCRAVLKEMEKCLAGHYQDPVFVEDVTQEFLKMRSEYRRTGIKQGTQQKYMP